MYACIYQLYFLKSCKISEGDASDDEEGEESGPFFEELPDQGKTLSFTEMNLSRPLLRVRVLINNSNDSFFCL